VHANSPLIFRAPLNLSALAVTHLKAVSEHEEYMKIALPALPGLAPGALSGAALGIGAGLASVEIFKATRFEGDSGKVVFFTVTPSGAAIGGTGCFLLFSFTSIRDAEIVIGRAPAGCNDR
jgi:hypothetical protein